MAFPSWARDSSNTEVEIVFNFWDRIKILLFGRVFVSVTTRTENIMGRTDVITGLRVYRPRLRKLGVVSHGSTDV